MKAVAIKDKRLFEIKNIKEPSNNGKDVIIEVKKAGICGSDIHYWEEGAPKGLVMGHEFCGIVKKVGSRSDLKVGDRVTALPISPCGKCEACLSGNVQYCRETWTNATGLSLSHPGGFTATIALRPDMVVKAPAGLSDEEVAMTEPTAVGLHAVNLANIKIGDKVLVIGAGIIGLVSAMFAKLNGAEYVAISETNSARGKKAVKLKVADEWIDALDKDFVTTALTKSNGGFDVVIECCGNTPAVSSAVMAVKPGGTVVLVGVSLKPISFPSAVSVMGEQTLKGAIAYTKEEFTMCLDLMAKKIIDVKKFVSKTIGLDGVQGAFEELTSGKTSCIKIMVDPKN